MERIERMHTKILGHICNCGGIVHLRLSDMSTLSSVILHYPHRSSRALMIHHQSRLVLVATDVMNPSSAVLAGRLNLNTVPKAVVTNPCLAANNTYMIIATMRLWCHNAISLFIRRYQPEAESLMRYSMVSLRFQCAHRVHVQTVSGMRAAFRFQAMSSCRTLIVA
jgi:hypothetical protein